MKKSIVIRPIPFIVNLIITLGLGGLVAYLTNPKDSLAAFTAPPLMPPPIVFAIVWSILYILMAFSYTLVMPDSDCKTIYFTQLAVNIVWSFIFFTFKSFILAFIWIILLIILVSVMIAGFYRKNKLAALLQIPYLIWLFIAGYLNLGFIILN